MHKTNHDNLSNAVLKDAREEGHAEVSRRHGPSYVAGVFQKALNRWFPLFPCRPTSAIGRRDLDSHRVCAHCRQEEKDEQEETEDLHDDDQIVVANPLLE